MTGGAHADSYGDGGHPSTVRADEGRMGVVVGGGGRRAAAKAVGGDAGQSWGLGSTHMCGGVQYTRHTTMSHSKIDHVIYMKADDRSLVENQAVCVKGILTTAFSVV